MKKHLLTFVALIALTVLFVPLVALAQGEPTKVFGVVIDPVTMAALLALVGGGIVTFVSQLIKSALHAEGTLAVVLTGVIAVAATLIYFWLIAPPLIFGKFLVYGLVMFGEATGYFHFYGPIAKKRAALKKK